MEGLVHFGELNHLAIVVAALSGFVIGGAWYSPALFGTAWCREAGVDPQKGGHPAKVFGGAFVLTLIGAVLLAILVGPAPSVAIAVHAGFVVGLGFIATSFGVNYLFAQRSLKLWLIDAGYITVQYMVMGLVLGLWH